jgi:hypothetical protein
MPKPKRKRTEKRSAAEKLSPQVTVKDRKGRWGAFIIAGLVIILILVILGISYYPTYIAPFRISVVTVDDVNIRMNYFLKRCKAAGADPLSMLTQIADEEVIKLEAPNYGISVTPETIDQALRQMAQGDSETISDSEFKEWYRQRLNEIGLSNSEYRDIIGTSLMASDFYDYLSTRMPTAVKQIHLNVILVDTEEEANQVQERWENGESFADLAREFSLDANSRENGGDIGWVPQGAVYESRYDSVIFDLDVNTLSEPLAYYDSSVEDPASPAFVNYYIFMVSEKADARQVDDQYLPTLRDNYYQTWLSQSMSLHTIYYHGFHDGFDSETYAWINWQLSKINKSSSSSTSQ